MTALVLPRHLCLLIASLSLAQLGCGGGDAPPDRPTSDAQIRRVIVDYNVLAAQGKGEAACDLMTEQNWERVDPALIPPELADEITDCASYWNWMGPRFPAAGREVMLDTQVAEVTISGEQATATATNGVVWDLRWVDGTWKLD